MGLRDQLRDQGWSLRLDLEAKTASLHDRSCLHDWMHGLVTVTGTLVCAYLLICQVCRF